MEKTTVLGESLFPITYTFKNKYEYKISTSSPIETLFKVGDTIKIVSHKFPELNPKKTENKTMILTPQELSRLYYSKKKPNEPDLAFYRNYYFGYQVKGLNYIGMKGVIVEIRNKPGCKYEKQTGDIARYVMKITDKVSGWEGSIVSLFPSQVELIKKASEENQKTFLWDLI